MASPVAVNQNTVTRDSLLKAFAKAQAEHLQVVDLGQETYQVKDYLVTVPDAQTDPTKVVRLFCTCPHGISHTDGICKHRAVVLAYRKYGFQPFAPAYQTVQ